MRKTLKKTAAAICAAVMTATLALSLPVTTTAVTADSDPDLIIHYNTSAGTHIGDNAWDNAESFYKALPIGNGRIGAMVYGNCPTERFDLNEATFWSGAPGSNNRKVGQDTMEHAWQQMLAGDYPGADGTISKNMIGGGMAKYLSVGTLNLDTGHRDVSGYDRYLDMNTGICGCSYSAGGKDVGYIQNGDYIAFRNIDFGSGATGFTVKAGSETGGGTISLRLDTPTGTEIGKCAVTGTEGWTTWKIVDCDVKDAEGKHTLYMVFGGDDGFLMNVDSFKFTTTIPQTTAETTALPVVSETTAAETVKTTESTPDTTFATQTRTPGDVNEDGKVTVSDAILLARIAAEDKSANVSSQGKLNGDLDGKAGLSAEDVTVLLKYIAGIIAELDA